MASPIAVPSPSCSASIAAVSRCRSVVGSTSAETVPLNEISPTSMSASTASTKSAPACLAASSRFGATSSASIDSETSNNRMIFPAAFGRVTERSTGWAAANTPIVSAASCTPATAWRRHPGRLGAICSSISICVKRTVLAARRRWAKRYATTRPATISNSHSRSGARKSQLIDGPSPGAAGAGARARRCRRANRHRWRAPASRRPTRGRSARVADVVRRQLGEATLHVAGDHDLAGGAGRRIGERDQTDGRHVELTWIDDADGEQVMAHRQRGHRRRPILSRRSRR